MERLTSVFALVFLLHAAHGQLLYKMETQTGSVLNAGNSLAFENDLNLLMDSNVVFQDWIEDL